MEYYDSRVSIHFQKSTWVITSTMTKLSEEFAHHAKDRHSGLGCVLFSENLSAHVADEAKDIFHKGNKFLCFYPPQSSESAQPMDIGDLRSLRFSVGNLL